jgi:hypothetical protein
MSFFFSLSIYLFVCLSVCLFVCLSLVCLPLVCLSLVCLPLVYLSLVCLSLVCVCLLSVCLFVCVSLSLFLAEWKTSAWTWRIDSCCWCKPILSFGDLIINDKSLLHFRWVKTNDHYFAVSFLTKENKQSGIEQRCQRNVMKLLWIKNTTF